MRRVIALAAVVLAGGCSDAPTLPKESPDPVAAHTPGHHAPSSAVVAVATPAYADLQGASVTNDRGAATLTVDVGGAIPRSADAYIGSVAVFGYAWADLGTGQAFVVVIHPLIGRDSNQNPDAWHTHPVFLGAGTGTSDFCIAAIGTSQGGIAIQGNRLRVNGAAHHVGVAAGDIDVAAAFIVQADAACAGTGLGVAILDAVTL